MKYRTDFVTNSSSSSNIILRMVSNRGSRIISYDFQEPGFWRIKPFSSSATFDLERLTDVGPDIFSLPNTQTSESILSYQGIYDHLILAKLRSIFHSIYNNPDLNEIGKFMAMTHAGTIYIDKARLDKYDSKKQSTEGKEIVSLLKCIVEAHKTPVNTFDELNHSILTNIFSLDADEVIKQFEERSGDGIYDEYSNSETSIVDVQELKLFEASGNPNGKWYLKNFINYKIQELINDGFDATDFQAQLNKKSMSVFDLQGLKKIVENTEVFEKTEKMVEKLSILLGDVNEFYAKCSKPRWGWQSISYSSLKPDYVNDVKSISQICSDNNIDIIVAITTLRDENLMNRIQHEMILKLIEFQKKKIDFHDVLDEFITLRKAYDLEEKKWREKNRKQKKRLAEKKLAESKDLSNLSRKVIFELDQNGCFPKTALNPILASVETPFGDVIIAFKPKSAINRITNLFLESQEEIFVAADIAKQTISYGDNPAELRADVLDAQYITEQIRNFFRLCLLYTNPRVLQTIYPETVKTKQGQLYVGRVTHIATLNLSRNFKFNELVAVNEKKNLITLEIRTVNCYSSDFDKAQMDKSPIVLFDEIMKKENEKS